MTTVIAAGALLLGMAGWLAFCIHEDNEDRSLRELVLTDEFDQ